MEYLIAAILFVIDIWLVVAVQRLGRKKETDENLLVDINEERRLIRDLSENIRIEMKNAQIQSREIFDKMSQLAIEAEQEVKSGGLTLAQSFEQVYGEFKVKFDAPFQELSRKQSEIEIMLRKLNNQKVSVVKLLGRAERICQFFDSHLPYEELLKDIEDKKYTDARSLLRQGMPPHLVAKELGLNEPDVRVMAAIARPMAGSGSSS